MTKKIYILFIFLFLLFFTTRALNLKNIPIFTDEAIYIRWAQIALNDPNNRFISLEDGKQPLFIWLAAISNKFVSDPLIATRLVSIFSGFSALIGIYLLGKELFSRKVGIISAFLYVILPFTVLYDRLAIYDSLLTMLGIYCVFFTVKLAKIPELSTAFLTAFSIGAAMITKSSGNFFLYLIPFSALLFNFQSKDSKKQFLKWVFLASVVGIISLLIFNLLRLSPLFYLIERKNFEFIRPLSDVLKNPALFTISNFKALLSWIAVYETYPFFLLSAVGLFYGIFKKNLSVLLLAIYIFAPFFAEVFFNKVLYPRFTLFYFPYFIILAAFAISVLFTKYKKYQKAGLVILFLIALFPMYITTILLTKPEKAPIPESDSNQYFNDWPAGFGVDQVKDLLKEKSKSEKVTVGTQGTFGLLPYGLQIYFPDNKNLQIIGYWPVDEKKLPQDILEASIKNKTYFIFNEYQGEVSNPRLNLIASYRKGVGNSYMRIFEVKPQ